MYPIYFPSQVLNEVVVDRGIGSSVTNVEIYCNGRFLTKLLGDGKEMDIEIIREYIQGFLLYLPNFRNGRKLFFY